MEKNPPKNLDPYPTMWCWPPEWQQIPRFDGFQKKQWSCAFQAFRCRISIAGTVSATQKDKRGQKCVDNSEVIESE